MLIQRSVFYKYSLSDTVFCGAGSAAHREAPAVLTARTAEAMQLLQPEA